MEGRREQAGYVALVALLVTATLAAGSVLFQVFEQAGHSRAQLAQTSAPSVAIDAAGFAITLLLGLQLMSGYRLIAVRGAGFRRLHVPTAWAVVGLLGFHAAAGVLHTFQGVVEPLPVALDVIGLLLLGLVAAQLTSGRRLSRPKSRRVRLVHASVALALVVVVAGHVALAIVHTLGA